jgi:hypothetical protein
MPCVPSIAAGPDLSPGSARYQRQDGFRGAVYGLP